MQIKHHLSEQLTTMPKDYELVNEAVESRNKKTVTIDRYQKDGVYTYNGERMIEVIENGVLVRFKDYSHVPMGNYYPMNGRWIWRRKSSIKPTVHMREDYPSSELKINDVLLLTRTE